MRAFLKDFIQLILSAVDGWTREGAGYLAGALAFNALFATAPLLIIFAGVAGIFLGREDVQAFLIVQVSRIAGPAIGETLNQLVTNTPTPQAGIIAILIGVVTLFLTAGGVVHFLRYALNRMWKLTRPAPKNGILSAILDQLFAVLVVLIGGGIVLLSMIGSALVGLFNDRLTEHFPTLANLIPDVSPFLYAGVIFVVFVLVFRFIPNGKIRTRDVIPGALFTLILFVIGQFGINLYLMFTSFSSVYGAAGSLVALLVWISYSAQIFFLGAEFTYGFANKHGAGITSLPQTAQPAESAEVEEPGSDGEEPVEADESTSEGDEE
jgi:membrane protein